MDTHLFMHLNVEPIGHLIVLEWEGKRKNKELKKQRNLNKSSLMKWSNVWELKNDFT